MPLQATSGAASYDAFGGGVPVVPNYIEEVFSTYLYTGTSANRSIINDIDLSTKGGLVWIKTRSEVWEHYLADTVRGTSKASATNNTSPEYTGLTNGLTSFNSNGFSLGIDTDREAVNRSPKTYASWTFRKQPKFFDVVTYTGNGAVQTINHNLASVPGCIIVKRTDSAVNWGVYHRSVASGRLYLNTTDAIDNSSITYVSSTSTSFTFEVGGSSVNNANGGTYVAYLFAHDAGGFGLTGTDNVISCGSFTTDGSGNATVNLGYEPQWLITKTTGISDDWYMADIMRGWTADGAYNYLLANTSGAESSVSGSYRPTATGFVVANGGASRAYIYIAIRRGPMKVPTSGTSVFKPAIRTGTATTATVTGVGFPPDAVLSSSRMYGSYGGYLGQFWDRLRGAGKALRTPDTAAEVTVTNAGVLGQDGYTVSNSSGGQNDINDPFVDYSFRRAPSFFDEVCYTGTGSALNPNHNLGVTPELKIIKSRSGAVAWIVGGTVIGGGVNFYMFLETNAIVESTNYWSSGSDSATTFSTRAGNSTSNSNGQTYVAYLFATCAGVSKVGSYTGTGTTQQINCGFTGGARFVLIKRTDSTGAWYFWDTARGIVSGNDPYLLLNTVNDEVTSTDYIDTYSAGFEISSTAPSAINASGGSFVFLAIA